MVAFLTSPGHLRRSRTSVWLLKYTIYTMYCGIRGCTFPWINCYLANKVQVVVDRVTSLVPQGTFFALMTCLNMWSKQITYSPTTVFFAVEFAVRKSYVTIFHQVAGGRGTNEGTGSGEMRVVPSYCVHVPRREKKRYRRFILVLWRYRSNMHENYPCLLILYDVVGNF